MKSVPVLLAALGVTALLSVAPLGAQPAATTIADHISKFAPSVISVRVTSSVTTSYAGRQEAPEEEEHEVSAVVVDPSGLAVLALESLDPSKLYSDWLGEMDEDIKFSADVKLITMHFADGKEAPGEIVIRDKDLEIVLIRPTTPISGAPAVDFSKSVEVKMLDQVLLISRLGKLGNWITAAAIEDVAGVFAKPRTMYFVPATVAGEETDIAALALSTGGEPVGIHIYRNIAAGDDSTFYTVVLPGKQIIPLIQQARQ